MRFISVMIAAVLMTACANKPVLPENLVQAQVMTDNNLAQAAEQSVAVQDAKQAVISAQKAEEQAQKANRKAEKAAKRAAAKAEKLAKVNEIIEQ